jgi:hypothetical protein
MVVRTDGNNFIAELAAAAITIKAVPPSLPLLLRIDSMATIGAITKGPVSERKRIRAAGRAWLNFSRSEFSDKMKDISVVHVSSHTGTQTPEQIGNDAADRIANKFRLQGESSPPAPYLWETEEALLFKHGKVSVQGDPRTYLKRLETDLMIRIWKDKAPKQAKWFTKHPTQILKQAKQVWKWSVESGKGRAWLYFIFAVCQWLPTNYRMNYYMDGSQKRCNLCLCKALDTMDHLLQCPALAGEHLHLKQKITAKFSSCITPTNSRDREFRNRWRSAATCY